MCCLPSIIRRVCDRRRRRRLKKRRASETKLIDYTKRRGKMEREVLSETLQHQYSEMSMLKLPSTSDLSDESFSSSRRGANVTSARHLLGRKDQRPSFNVSEYDCICGTNDRNDREDEDDNIDFFLKVPQGIRQRLHKSDLRERFQDQPKNQSPSVIQSILSSHARRESRSRRSMNSGEQQSTRSISTNSR